MKAKEKVKLLNAMQTVYTEYKENRHLSNVNNCSMCQLFITPRLELYHDCHKCPMYVFNANAGDDFPCLYRRCEPVWCLKSTKDTVKLRAVTLFYEKAIERVTAMTPRQLSSKNAFKFLLDIDEEVAVKYKIGKNERRPV